MFAAGPANYLSRLESVDTRLKEFKTRAAESPKVCLKKEAQKFEPSLPNGEQFLMYFSCKEKMGSLTVYFGRKDGQNYLAELQLTDGTTPTLAVLAKIDNAGTKAEVWQIMVDNTSPYAVSVIHIRADQSTNTNHIIVAATKTGLGVGCGIKLSSTTDALWVYGSPGDNGVGDNFSGAVSCPSTNSAEYSSSTEVANVWYSFCFNPSTSLSVLSSTLCASLSGSNFPLSSFSYAQLGSTNYGSSAYTMITNPTMPSGLTDFTEVEK